MTNLFLRAIMSLCFPKGSKMQMRKPMHHRHTKWCANFFCHFRHYIALPVAISFIVWVQTTKENVLQNSVFFSYSLYKEFVDATASAKVAFRFQTLEKCILPMLMFGFMLYCNLGANNLSDCRGALKDMLHT